MIHVTAAGAAGAWVRKAYPTRQGLKHQIRHVVIAALIEVRKAYPTRQGLKLAQIRAVLADTPPGQKGLSYPPGIET